MTRWLVWVALRLLRWTLAIVGAVALLLTAMIATPLTRPPELASISQTAHTSCRSSRPTIAG